MNKAVLILGMHRSGTSYLAHCLHSVGVHLGDCLIGAQKGNPRGHFEERSFVEFHQKVLRRKVAQLPRPQYAFDDGMLVGACAEGGWTENERVMANDLMERHRKEGLWGWKEPRTCLFLEEWAKILGAHSAIGVYRHPLEVHFSLLRRGHWDLALFPDQAYAAYSVYNGNLCRHVASLGDRGLLFNASAGFAELSRLEDLLRNWLSCDAGLFPKFFPGEFHSIRISRSLHRLFSLIVPTAAAVFDKLQKFSVLPYLWQERSDDGNLEAIAERLEPWIKDAPPSVRARVMPFLDCIIEPETSAEAIEEMAIAIGGRFRRVEEWNRKASEIHNDNRRLAADNERLTADNVRMAEEIERVGTGFEQLKMRYEEQVRVTEKIWDDLAKVSDNWKVQRDGIEDLKKQIAFLQKENARLRETMGSAGLEII